MPVPIWVFYDGPMTALQELCVESMRRMNPATRVVGLNDICQLGGAEQVAITDGLPWARRSDLFRFWLLYQFGGVWLDVDSIATRPLDFLDRITSCDLVGVYNRQETHLRVIGTPIGARQGSHLMLCAYNRCREHIERLREGVHVPYAATSVGVLTAIAGEALCTGHRAVTLLEHWRYNRIPFYRAQRAYLRRRSSLGHSRCRDWGPRVCVYHLTSRVCKQPRLQEMTRHDLLEGTMFLSFLLQKSLVSARQ